MADGTVAAKPVLRQTQVNHMSSKDKMEEFKNSVSGPFKHGDDIAALSNKLENLAQNTPLRFSAEAMRPSIICSPRFGNMSNHSFFSRHNPHPHRVTHIQGLNGNPICIVNDEWSVTSPLCPHPMIKNQLNTNLLGVTCSLPIGDPYANKVPFLASGTISEAWRDELKELAAKVGTADKQAVNKEQSEEPRRTTQYSAETGRLIPPSSRTMTSRASRRTHRNSNNKGKHPTSIFQDQELLVLELLCQILQTDSLSAIQQWLLLAGPREKDLVMKMIQTATANMKLESNSMDRSMHDRLHSQAALGLISRDTNLQRKDLHSSHKEKPEPIAEEDKPERIGTAEVLQVHYSSDDENQSKSTSSN
uniref:Thymus, brain and testes associated n=1 Tax=Leptobrachium leishanense TaxID=445787 RepID=A0A8C5PT21_9ANUR